MKLFHSAPSRTIDEANFNHFVWDVAWFGIALAATKSFLQIYAIRLEANPIQIALITSLPAIFAMFSSMTFSGHWRSRFPNSVQAVRIPTFMQRFVFLLPAFAPFFPEPLRPVWLIAAICLPALGEGIGAVMFLSLFRETISEKMTTSLLSRRTLAMNVAIAVTTILLLIWFWGNFLPFPYNYQIMFAIAFLGALGSYYHVISVRAKEVSTATVKTPSKINVWRSANFRKVIFTVVVTHVAFMSVYAVQPIHLVKELGANEVFMAAFGLLELLGAIIAALLVEQIVARIGNSNTMALSMIVTAIAALIIALAPNLWITLIAAVYSWGGWTVTGITLFRLFTEKTRGISAQDMVKYSGVYYQTVALSVFVGPLLGSSLANAGVNLVFLLVAGASLRFIAAMLTQKSVVEHIVHSPTPAVVGAGD
jgi:MFS family permease